MLKLFSIFIFITCLTGHAQEEDSFVNQYIQKEGKEEEAKEVDKALNKYFNVPENPCSNQTDKIACFQSMFNSQGTIEDNKLIEISKQLKLKDKKLISSENRKDITTFFIQRLRKMLQGDNEKEVDVAQSTLAKLHKRQLEKNALQDLTVFCRHRFDFAQRDQRPWKPSATIDIIDISSTDDSAIKEDIAQVRSNPQFLSTCFKKIGLSCKSNSTAYDEEACVMRSRVRRYNQLLAKSGANIEYISNRHEKFEDKNPNEGLGITTYEGNENKASAEEITTITSHDFKELEDDYLKENREKALALIERCKNNNQDPACNKITSTKLAEYYQREKKKIIAQTALNLSGLDKITGTTVQHEDKTHRENLQHLIDTYLTKEEKENLDLQMIKQKIKDRYAQERAALLSELDKKAEEQKQTPDDLSRKMREQINRLKNDQLFNNIAQETISGRACERSSRNDNSNECQNARTMKLNPESHKLELEGLKKYAPKFAKEEKERQQASPERSVANDDNIEIEFTQQVLDSLINSDGD